MWNRWQKSSLLLILLLGTHAVFLAYNASWMSPTLNEPAHAISGLSHWRFGDFSLYRVNPPLVRSLAALPMMLAGYEMEFPETLNSPLGRSELYLGDQFILKNGRRSLWLITLGRWACIPLSLLGALVCYWWARDLFGPASGIAACSLWCFSPLVLGHAALLTPDVGGAALGALACYTFWLWLKQPTWRRTLTTGVILGIAELAKTTLILFYPLWPLLWLVYRWPNRAAITARDWWEQGLMLAARMLIGLYIINLAYLGLGSFIPLKEYQFSSKLLGAMEEGQLVGNRFRSSWLGEIPMPVPYDYVLGIDHQQRDFEHFWGPSYLRGQLQEKGWWYYYLYGVAVKTPLGTLSLTLLAAVTCWRRKFMTATWTDQLVLLAPAMFVFIVVSSKTGFSHHLRYIFPCIPLVMIWVSQSFSSTNPIAQDGNHEESLPTKTGGKRSLALPTCAWVCWTATVVSSLWHFPHSLSYFNELAGGPYRGPEHLLNSNIN